MAPARPRATTSARTRPTRCWRCALPGFWAYLQISLNDVWEREAEPLPGHEAPPAHGDEMPPRLDDQA